MAFGGGGKFPTISLEGDEEELTITFGRGWEAPSIFWGRGDASGGDGGSSAGTDDSGW